VSQNLDARRDFKQTFFIAFGIKAKLSWPCISCQRLRMTVLKKPMGYKGFRFEGVGGARQERESLSRREPGFLPLNFYYFAAGKHVYENLCKQGCLRIGDEKELPH
jgi:hypothetical protein